MIHLGAVAGARRYRRMVETRPMPEQEVGRAGASRLVVEVPAC